MSLHENDRKMAQAQVQIITSDGKTFKASETFVEKFITLKNMTDDLGMSDESEPLDISNTAVPMCYEDLEALNSWVSQTELFGMESDEFRKLLENHVQEGHQLPPTDARLVQHITNNLFVDFKPTTRDGSGYCPDIQNLNTSTQLKETYEAASNAADRAAKELKANKTPAAESDAAECAQALEEATMAIKSEGINRLVRFTNFSDFMDCNVLQTLIATQFALMTNNLPLKFIRELRLNPEQ